MSGLLISKKEAAGPTDPDIKEATCKKAYLQGLASDPEKEERPTGLTQFPDPILWTWSQEESPLGFRGQGQP